MIFMLNSISRFKSLKNVNSKQLYISFISPYELSIHTIKALLKRKSLLESKYTIEKLNRVNNMYSLVIKVA